MGYQGLKGFTYTLELSSFSQGGEGDIFRITNDIQIGGIHVPAGRAVAKIYHPDRINKELENKLKAMVNNPPNSSVLNQVAWPLDLLYLNRIFSGFVMPKLDISDELIDLYQYPPNKYINFTLRQKLIIAQNICAVIEVVHRAGYVFGDFNPRNIGVNISDGKVAFLDTDSYHFFDKTVNYTYRCKVCLDGYVAPELLRACANYPQDAYALAPLPTFTQETDNFALAIHIFKLLMNGFTPYNGIKTAQRSSTAAPGVGNNAIRQDNYCFKPGNKPQAAAVPPIDVLPQDVANLFTRAFVYGKADPKQRPSAIEWYKALGTYECSLTVCPINSTHMYRTSLPSCPWCEADKGYIASLNPRIPQRTYPPVVSPKNIGPTIPTRYGGGGTPTIPVNVTQKKNPLVGISRFVISVIVLFIIIKAVSSGLANYSPAGNNSSNNSSSATYSSNESSTSADNGIPDSSPTDVSTAKKQPAPIPTKNPCPEAKPLKFKKGDTVLIDTNPDRLIVRRDGDVNANEVVRICFDSTVKIVDGPKCSDNSNWWYIEAPAGTITSNCAQGNGSRLNDSVNGWVREAGIDFRDGTNHYFLAPLR